MKVLLFGSTGLLGQSVNDYFQTRGHEVIGVARSNAKITMDIRDEKSLISVLKDESADAVINCAALVDIERCETDRPNAWAINANPLASMSSWADKTGRPLVHISTDQFYTGDGALAHDEEHPVTILNNYACTKFVGDQIALSSAHSLVLRTAIVGIRGWERLTFAELALDAVVHNREIRLFKDAYTSAIDVRSVAQMIASLLDGGHRGLFNVGAREVYSKADFVLQVSSLLEKPLTNAAFGSVAEMPARRGDSLGLNVTKVEKALSRQMPTLEDVVSNVIRQQNTRNKNAL